MLASPANRRTRCAVAATAVAAVLTAGLAAASPSTALQTPSSAGRRPTPPAPVVRTLPVPSTSSDLRGSGSPVVARMAPTPTADFGLIAVTWDHSSASANLAVIVRARVSGAWTPWQRLPVETSEGPSAAEETTVRDGTAPAWVGDADGVAVRVTAPDGRAPSGLRVVTIEAPTADPPAGQTAPRGVAYVAPTGKPILHPPAFPGMPSVVTRKQWGANPKLGDKCWDPVYGKSAKMVFIHHTVNSNDYTPSEGAAIVRSIQAYHTQGRGWCDIGYNFLVDRYGTIYEGRRGGMRLPVRGAHAGDFNTNTVGISLIGNFDVAKVPSPMKNAVVRLVGWRLGTSYDPAFGKVGINHQRFSRISGHRDAMSTTCPGRYAYAWLPKLRHRVNAYLSRFSSTIAAKRERLGKSVTGPVFVGEIKVRGGRRTEFGNGMMFAKPGDGTHWLAGRALTGYRSMHTTFGRLGFPRTDRRDTAVDGVSTVGFEHGRMFLVPHSRARVLWGRILLRYQKLGSVSGRLGAPTSGMISTATGARTTFEHGGIAWDRSTGRVTVTFS